MSDNQKLTMLGVTFAMLSFPSLFFCLSLSFSLLLAFTRSVDESEARASSQSLYKPADDAKPTGSMNSESDPATAAPGPSPSEVPKETKKQARERERLARVLGKLTDLSFRDITCLRNGNPDFIKEGVLLCVRGSKSQFDARTGRMKSLMPPLTCDCCQTFSTLSAVFLSSLGFAVMLGECLTTSTVNYLLYISAWMHQLSVPRWTQGRSRPTVGDLNTCLHLRDFFPSKVAQEEFEIVFYNQGDKAQQLLRQLCTSSTKRGRGTDGKLPVCGFVIVSGDYTISVFAVDHDIRETQRSRYSQAWSFYICDSHGTQPWSQGKACLSGLTFGTPAPETSDDHQSVLTVEDGVHYFSTILFTLLEEHRKGVVRSTQIPYMTWTPLRRRRSLAYTAQELKTIIDTHWIPKVLSDRAIQLEAEKYSFKPLECFWGGPPTTLKGGQPNGEA